MNKKLTTLSNNNDDKLDKLPEAIKNIFNFVTEHYLSIRKVKRNNEKLESELWKRSIDEVINSGETFYMKSCTDFTLSLVEKLKKQISENDKIFLGIEKLKRIKSGIEDIHLYAEILDRKQKYIIDFARDNLIYLYSGEYKTSRPHEVESISTNSIPSLYFDGNDSIISIANKIGEGKNIEKFLGNINNLKKHNTDEQFQDFEKRMNNKIKINVEGKWYELDVDTWNKDISDGLYSVLSM